MSSHFLLKLDKQVSSAVSLSKQQGAACHVNASSQSPLVLGLFPQEIQGILFLFIPEIAI